jgi:transcriptional regulator with XRE-family HTH domain
MRLRRVRQEQGLTLGQVAQRAGLSISYLNDLEHDRNAPSLGRLQAIAIGLETSVVSLLTGVSPYDD